MGRRRPAGTPTIAPRRHARWPLGGTPLDVLGEGLHDEVKGLSSMGGFDAARSGGKGQHVTP